MIQLSEKTVRRKRNERANKKLRAKQAKISGRKPARDAKYLAWIRTLDCAVLFCDQRRFPNMMLSVTEAAHVGKVRGLGQKCSDYEAIPLCRYHHREQHRLQKRFWVVYSLDREAIISALRARYELLKKGAA